MVADNLGPTWILLTWIWTRTSNTQNLGGGQSAKKSENPKNSRFFGTKLKKKYEATMGRTSNLDGR